MKCKEILLISIDRLQQECEIKVDNYIKTTSAQPGPIQITAYFATNWSNRYR